eukprot:TRINITY_DN13434_c0_g1_i1.p1 TRINITY_DN13434_c0_g1~~TRINITY_DN13434_c0_g1_i1.p1  ORF type:complete len:222 (-),score=56.65 TRINITY_DN13434_c0_g1_i1:359-1024(-)
MATRLVFLLMTMALVGAAMGATDWEAKYKHDFGSLEADDRLATPTGKMVKEWLSPNWQNTSVFAHPLKVWNNGWVSRDAGENPVSWEQPRGGWEELYAQREIVRHLSSALENVTDTSEADYPLVAFISPAPASFHEEAITPADFTELMGLKQAAGPFNVTCGGTDNCEQVLGRTLEYLEQHTQNVQQLTVLAGDWVVFPTFLFGQRSDGTLVGVCSTEIST